MKRFVGVLILLIALVAAGIGCKSSSSSSSAGADQPASTPAPVQAKTASVTFAAKFPSKNSTVKSLINPATTMITVNWYELSNPNNGTGSVTLTPQSPTATVMLAPVKYAFEAIATNGTGTTNILDKAASAGKLNVGANTVNITFLSGKWTFKDGTGTTTTPIELSTGSGSLIVDGFYLSGLNGNLMSGSTGTSAMVNTLPHIEVDYLVTWGTGSWSDTTREAYARHYTQFTGGPTNIDVYDGGFYNLTQGCNDWGNGCDAVAGDREIGIIGASPDNNNQGAYQLLPPQTFSTDIMQYATSKIVDGTTITGNMLEILTTAKTVTIVYTGATGSAIPAKAVFAGGKKATLLAATAGAVKSAQSTNTLISALDNTWYEAVIVCKDGYNNGAVDGIISLGTWSFQQYICDKPNCSQDNPCNCYPDPSPAGFCGRGNVIATAADGVTSVYEYYECGNPQWVYDPALGYSVPDSGECNFGLVATDTANLGEYCPCGIDNSTGQCWPAANCGNQPAQPWSFYDVNNDGVIDFGSFVFAHYLREDSTMDLYVYPFTAKGTPAEGTQVIVSSPK